MILPEQLPELRRMIRAQAARDSRLLSELVRQARELAQDVRPLRPRAATAVALTAADGGNNAVAFNPFSLQIVRVVDSRLLRGAAARAVPGCPGGRGIGGCDTGGCRGRRGGVPEGGDLGAA